MAAVNTNSHPYTCNTCLVAFKGSELQRGHMQSDWHRYNLKRRVASLPPLSSEIFTEKVLANQATAAATAAKASFERICAPCQRTYYSENAYQNHLASQKHRTRLNQLSKEQASLSEDPTASLMSSTFSLGTPLDTTSRVSDETVHGESTTATETSRILPKGDVNSVADQLDKSNKSSMEQNSRISTSLSNGENDSEQSTSQLSEQYNTSDCLFCSYKSADLDSNVSHMGNRHGMFIPERDYLVDLDGLIGWLQARIHLLHECLRCGMVKRTAKGIQTHMRDKGHCMIDFESEEQMIEVGQFYDFTSTYSDDEFEMDEEEEGGEKQTKLGARRDKSVNLVDDAGNTAMEDIDDDGWQTDESDSGEGSQQASTTQNHKQNPWQPKAIYHDEDGLHLPSGRTAGHREFAKYWRQNLRNYPSTEERANQRAITDGEGANSDSDSKIIVRGRQQNAITRANGGLGMLGVTDAKKKEAGTLELADRKRAQRAQNRYQAGNERRANAQKHFRDPLLQ